MSPGGRKYEFYLWAFGVSMAVNVWSSHFMSAWEEKASNTDLPVWLRITCLAFGTHAANGHATFKPGVLVDRIGKPAPRISEGIAAAVRYGFLDSESCAQCLVVPSHMIELRYGKPKRCEFHGRRLELRRSEGVA